MALAVTSFLIPLALAESLLRLHSGPPPRLPPPTPYRRLTPRGPRLIPGAEVDFLFESTVQPVRVAINSHGFRGPGLRRDPHSARILFLGDSVAFGYGVPQESTFVALLGKEWDRRSLAWEAVNGGVEDAGIVEERMLLEDMGEAVSPSAVVVCFYANDSRPPVGFTQEFILEDPVDRWLRTHPQVLARSRLASFVHFRYRRLLTSLHLYRSSIPARFAWVDLWRSESWREDTAVLDSLITLARYDWGAAWQEESWALVERELKRIRHWCIDHDVQLGVCYSPVQVEIEGPVRASTPAGVLATLCDAQGIPFLDLRSALRGRERCFFDQCHYTPRGHRLVAMLLEEWLGVWHHKVVSPQRS